MLIEIVSDSFSLVANNFSILVIFLDMACTIVDLVSSIIFSICCIASELNYRETCDLLLFVVMSGIHLCCVLLEVFLKVYFAVFIGQLYCAFPTVAIYTFDEFCGYVAFVNTRVFFISCACVNMCFMLLFFLYKTCSLSRLT
jgi:hypothetical protein